MDDNLRGYLPSNTRRRDWRLWVVMQSARLWKGARQSQLKRYGVCHIAVHGTYHNRQAMSGWAAEQDGRKRRCSKRRRRARRSMIHMNPGRAWLDDRHADWNCRLYASFPLG